MAQPEMRGSAGRPSETFDQLVQGLFDITQLEGMSRELGGFKGSMGVEIGKWHEEGLGRIIGVPLTKVTPGYIPPENSYRALVYALPLTDESVTGNDIRVALIFPQNNITNVCVVGPKISTVTEERDRARENEYFQSKFTTQFLPSDVPYVHPFWRPQEGKIPCSSFIENASVFSAIVYTTVFSKGEREAVIAKALTNARKLKERRYVASLRIDNQTLSTALDPDVVVLMGELDDSFRRFEEEKGF